MSLLISYDIEDNYLRQKIANYILDAGLARVQYSVYIGTVREIVVNDLLDWLQKIPGEKRWAQREDKQDSIFSEPATGKRDGHYWKPKLGSG